MPIDHGRSGEVKVCSFEEIGGLVMAMFDDECEGEAGCEEEEEGEEGEEDGCAPAVGGEVVRVAGGGGGGGEQRGLFCHRKVTAVGERSHGDVDYTFMPSGGETEIADGGELQTLSDRINRRSVTDDARPPPPSQPPRPVHPPHAPLPLPPRPPPPPVSHSSTRQAG